MKDELEVLKEIRTAVSLIAACLFVIIGLLAGPYL